MLMLGITTYESDWMIDGDVLKKGFRYNDLVEPASFYDSRILITKYQSEGRYDYALDLVFSPSPWPKSPDSVVVSKLFLDKKSTQQILVKFSFGHQDSSAVLSAETIEDKRSFLTCLAQCRPMHIITKYGLGNPVVIPIPNDVRFSAMAQTYFV